jgi:hypothetical protein
MNKLKLIRTISGIFYMVALLIIVTMVLNDFYVPSYFMIFVWVGTIIFFVTDLILNIKKK